MRIRAAVLERTGAPLVVEELELAPPGPGEVLVRLGASGICHSDQNAIDGVDPVPFPTVLGHEGAGVVEAIGPGVRRVAVGDHVALSWMPSCGECARMPARAPAPVLDRARADGPRHAARRHLAALSRRRDGPPLLVHLVLRRGVRAARALVRADPARRAVRGRRPRRLRDLDRDRRGLADGGRAPGRARRGGRLRRRRAVGGARRGRRGGRDGRSRSTSRSEARLRHASSAPPPPCCGPARPRRPPRRCARPAAVASTTRSRRPGARRRCSPRSSRRAPAAPRS